MTCSASPARTATVSNKYVGHGKHMRKNESMRSSRGACIMRTMSTRRSVSTRRDGNSCAVRGAGGERAAVVTRRWISWWWSKAGRIGGFGGGWLEHPRPWQGAQWAGRFPSGCLAADGVPGRPSATKPPDETPPPRPAPPSLAQRRCTQ